MLKSKLIYLVILVSMFLFYILFVDSMSLMIFVLTAAFPFLQLIILKRISSSVKASLITENQTINKNTESRIIVKIKNNSLLPVSCAVAELHIANTLTGESQTLTTMLPVSADNEQSIKFSVSYEHCGRIIITLKSIRVFDYIKLFSKTINYSISREITVVPEAVSISPEVETTLSTMTDNEEFSKIRPGDDCSEIFNIREYSYGDKINRIHWNLTTKLDELMVKEYSLPVSTQIIIIFEFCSDPDSEDRLLRNDAALETVMSLSYHMIANSISHLIAWYDPKTRMFNTEKILSEEDFSAFLSSVFASGTYTDDCSAFIHHKTENSESHYSHALYISPVISDEIFHNFSVLRNAYNKTFLYINNGYDLPDYFRSSDTAQAVSVRYGNIAEGLNKVIV